MVRHKKQKHQGAQIQELIKTNTTILVHSKSTSTTADFNVPVDELFKHFQLLHSAPGEKTFSKTQEIIMEGLKCIEQSLMRFNELDSPFTEEEIKNGIKKLKNKKAAGTDRIRNEMLKSGRHFLTTSLKKLFNLILEAGTFPDCWSMGLITPIFKSRRKVKPD